MRTLLNYILAMLILLTTACKKDKNPASGGVYSFSNTEYVGTAQVGNHYFPRPLSLRFGSDNTVSAWSNLRLRQIHPDSKGVITKVETGSQGETIITVLFDLPGRGVQQ